MRVATERQTWGFCLCVRVCVREEEKERMGFPSAARAGGCQGSFRGGPGSRESWAEGWGNLRAVSCSPACREAGAGGGREAGSLGRPRGRGPGEGERAADGTGRRTSCRARPLGARSLLCRESVTHQAVSLSFICPSPDTAVSPQCQHAENLRDKGAQRTTQGRNGSWPGVPSWATDLPCGQCRQVPVTFHLSGTAPPPPPLTGHACLLELPEAFSDTPQGIDLLVWKLSKNKISNAKAFGRWKSA